MKVEPFSREKIEAMRPDIDHSDAPPERWLATVDARDADLASLRSTLAEREAEIADLNLSKAMLAARELTLATVRDEIAALKELLAESLPFVRRRFNRCNDDSCDSIACSARRDAITKIESVLGGRGVGEGGGLGRDAEPLTARTSGSEESTTDLCSPVPPTGGAEGTETKKPRQGSPSGA